MSSTAPRGSDPIRAATSLTQGARPEDRQTLITLIEQIAEARANGARQAPASNAGSLINYGERYRAGERISSCLAESSVNAVNGKCFAKRQQMQWTKRSAHLVLQTQTRALDGTPRSLFEEWYPGLVNDKGLRPLKPRQHKPQRP